MKKAIFLFLAITTLIACNKKDPVNESIAIVGKSYYLVLKNSYNQDVVSTIYFEDGNKLRYIQTREVVNGEIISIANGTYTYNHPYVYAKITYKNGDTTDLTGNFINNKTIITESKNGYNYVYKLVE